MGPSGPIFFCNNIGAIASILRQPLCFLLLDYSFYVHDSHHVEVTVNDLAS